MPPLDGGSSVSTLVINSGVCHVNYNILTYIIYLSYFLFGIHFNIKSLSAFWVEEDDEISAL